MQQLPNQSPNQQARNSRTTLWTVFRANFFQILTGFLILCAILLAIAIAFVVIKDLADLGAELGFSFFEFFTEATINPAHPEGFKSFLILVFTAAFVYAALYLVSKRR